MRMLVRVLKALADPNRIRIMKMLQHRTMCVCELTEALGIAQPSVSRHMRVLENADLVEQRKEGPWVNYLWNHSPVNPFARELLERMRDWLQEDPEVQTLLLKASKLDRNIICRRSQIKREVSRSKDSSR
ncbi:MAG: metalloregulator ArsR/SmtB family transcription factor [bacterium]